MNKVVLVLTGVVVLGIAGFATVWFRAASTLQDQATDVLVLCRDGQHKAVYDEATEGFRNRWALDEFVAYLEYWKERLGAFKSVERRLNVSTSMGGGKTTKSATLQLEYERGAAEGQFDFEEDENGIRLLHLSLRPFRRSATPRDRAALVMPSEAMLRAFGDGKTIDLYAALSSDLQRSSGYTAFTRGALKRSEAMGPIGRISVKGTADESDDTVTYIFDLDGERADGTAKVGWHRVRNRWEVVEFTIDVSP